MYDNKVLRQVNKTMYEDKVRGEVLRSITCFCFFIFIRFGDLEAPRHYFYKVWGIGGSQTFIFIRFGALEAPRRLFL